MSHPARRKLRLRILCGIAAALSVVLSFLLIGRIRAGFDARGGFEAGERRTAGFPRPALARCPEPGFGRAPPSFILIVADTLRADYLGTYGFQGGVSPSIDELADESIVFEEAVSAAPWTKPAVASLLTGLPPHAHGVAYHTLDAGEMEDWRYLRDHIRLPRELDTLAEHLCARGYATAAVVTNSWLSEGLGYEQGFETYDDTLQAGGKWKVDGLALRRAREWLEARPDDRPFFLYIHLMDPHAPYTAPERDYEAVRDSPSIEGGRMSAEELASLPDYFLEHAWLEDGGARDLSVWRGRYAAGVRALDRHLEPFLEYVERERILDTAWLVFTADHGEELLDHGGWDHGYNLFEHQIHVPLFVRLPGGTGGGRRVSHPVSLLDIVPTVLRAVGAEVPAGLGGRDLASLLEGGGSRPTYGEAYSTAVRDNPNLFSVRTSSYKYIVDGATGRERLYDLRTDPDERVNLVEERSLVADRLRSRMEGYRALGRAVEVERGSGEPIDEDLLERLRSLGYVD